MEKEKTKAEKTPGEYLAYDFLTFLVNTFLDIKK